MGCTLPNILVSKSLPHQCQESSFPLGINISFATDSKKSSGDMCPLSDISYLGSSFFRLTMNGSQSESNWNALEKKKRICQLTTSFQLQSEDQTVIIIWLSLLVKEHWSMDFNQYWKHHCSTKEFTRTFAQLYKITDY